MWGRKSASLTDTDLIAARAYTLLEAQRCACGCRGWVDECLDAELQDVWEPVVGVAWRDAALARGREHLQDELKEPGAFLYLRDTRTER